MRNLILTLGLTLYSSFLFCQNNDLNSEHIIELGKHYSSFMFMNDAPKRTSKSLGYGYDDDMSAAVDFIREVTKSKNKILTDKFLVLPDTTTLRVLYIVDALHQNPHLEDPRDPKKIVDSLKNSVIPFEYLVDEYYSTIFVSVGNKNKPFNLSKVNFDLKSYGLNSTLLQGVFYLRCMSMCGSEIFGYMNIVKPPNTEKALSYIENFPKFNDLTYFQFTDLNFEDFQMEVYNDSGEVSYKDHFINKLYDVLVNHLICLTSEEKSKEEILALVLGSVLKDTIYYKHTEHKELLESLFEKQ